MRGCRLTSHDCLALVETWKNMGKMVREKLVPQTKPGQQLSNGNKSLLTFHTSWFTRILIMAYSTRIRVQLGYDHHFFRAMLVSWRVSSKGAPTSPTGQGLVSLCWFPTVSRAGWSFKNHQGEGYLLYIGDEILPSYCRDYFINHEIRIPFLTNQDSMESKAGFFGPWLKYVAWFSHMIYD